MMKFAVYHPISINFMYPLPFLLIFKKTYLKSEFTNNIKFVASMVLVAHQTTNYHCLLFEHDENIASDKGIALHSIASRNA